MKSALSLCTFVCVFAARAADADFFAEKVRPILEERCYKCHSHESGKSKGGLLLDSGAAILAGGEDGAVVVPGKPDESLLVKAIRQEDEDTKMPPKGDKLKEAEIAVIADWIKQGAVLPAEVARPTGKRVRGKITDEDRQWWAFQLIKKVEPPPSATGNPIDGFIQARLEKEGLAPAPEAPRAALIRRVTFDLTGLPPTPQEVDAFVADSAPDAYQKLADRQLSSPRFGEWMARAWLDLVRYADGDGYRADDYRPMPGATATTSSALSTTTSPTTASSANSSRATSFSPATRTRSSPPATCGTASTNGMRATCAASGT